MIFPMPRGNERKQISKYKVLHPGLSLLSGNKVSQVNTAHLNEALVANCQIFNVVYTFYYDWASHCSNAIICTSAKTMCLTSMVENGANANYHHL